MQLRVCREKDTALSRRLRATKSALAWEQGEVAGEVAYVNNSGTAWWSEVWPRERLEMYGARGQLVRALPSGYH